MQKSGIKAFAGLTIVVFLVALLLQQIPAFQSLELKTLDWRFEWRGMESVDDVPIVIIAIDDQSFESLPDRWPWPRNYYAHLVENLTRAGAAVIGLDLIFDIPDPYGPGKDQELADAIRSSGRVVLTGKLEQRSLVGQVQSYVYTVKPLPILLEADSTWGLVSIQADPDGLYRRYIVSQQMDKKIFPSFGLQVLKKFKHYAPDVRPIFENDLIKFGDITIPLFDQNSILINFAGPAGTFPYYSFESVIDDENFALKEDYDLNYFEELLEAGVFKDKIVLVGSTAAELHDNFPTPFLEFETPSGEVGKAEMPGVEIHANAIRTILNGLYYLHFPFWALLLVILVLILIMEFLSFKLPTLWSTVAMVGMILLYNGAQFYLFSNHRVVMEMVLPTLAIFLGFVSTNLYQYVITQKEKQLIIGAFEHYVPKKVVKELLEHPEKLTLGGEERFLTVMFSDIAGFTTISEKMSPRDLVHLINEYLTEMTNIILKYDGIVDKYEGDAIMAEFGAPVYFDDHALKACLAALEMQERLKQLNKKWGKENRPEIVARVGINSGNMIVGNMGSHQVFDYTVMGDEVNLAARLEGANKIFNTRIMISESTYHLVKDELIVRPLDLIRVKGKQKPVQVFEVIGRKGQKLDGGLQDILPVYINGIRYYQNQQWKQAAECFHYCLRMVPEDGPSKLYLKRIMEYQKNPPPPNWDGVFTLQVK